MKNAFWILLVGLGVMLAGCAAITPVPEGSQPLGTYQGLMWGGIDGPIQVNLFQTPKGDTVFSGKLVNAANGAVSEFHGTVMGNYMDGKIGLILGTIDGQLSADGTQMSGSLKLAQFHATWSASQQ
jgi:hypothetical protein